jgi:hypothetical protein
MHFGDGSTQVLNHSAHQHLTKLSAAMRMETTYYLEDHTIVAKANTANIDGPPRKATFRYAWVHHLAAVTSRLEELLASMCTEIVHLQRARVAVPQDGDME